jgi:hypothetical protein
MVIEKWSDVNKILMLILNDAMKEVGEKAENLFRSHLASDVYINRNKVYANYTRMPTYDLLNSTSHSIESGMNNVTMEVYHAKNKMRIDMGNFIHGSNINGNPVDNRERLPFILNDGLQGVKTLFGQGWWTEPRRYIDNSINILDRDKVLKKWLIDALRARGVEVN